MVKLRAKQETDKLKKQQRKEKDGASDQIRLRPIKTYSMKMQQSMRFC